MECRLQLNRILLLSLVTICAAGTPKQTFYDVVEPGKSLKGTVLEEFRARYEIQCSVRCSVDAECGAYQFTRSRPGNCILIHRNSTAENGQTFTSNGQSILFKKACTPPYSWNEPSGWTGPCPVVYQSFDCSDGLVMMEGTEQANLTFISGKINNAISLNGTRSQWVDLGILTEACITRPETCGSAGAAVAFWMRITNINVDSVAGVISSYHGGSQTRFMIYLNGNTFRYQVYILEGGFFASLAIPSGWTNVVLNYIGPNNGQGIQMFLDGVLRGSDDTRNSGTNSPRDGRVVVGRQRTSYDINYGSVDVDELLFFNEN